MLNIDKDVVLKALKDTNGVAGRFETVQNDKGISVIVDYAHTPDALENILNTAKEFAKGNIITVFGCGGDRDATKRPLMGKISQKLSDTCIVTSDNPRTEDPKLIIDDILGDATKRPLMGKISQKLSDTCIVTSDNPRTEDPKLIIDDILDGLDKENKNYKVIIDRKEAIEEAIKMAKKDDVVIIAGKGHENYQIIGQTKHHFDDKEIARDCLAKL